MLLFSSSGFCVNYEKEIDAKRKELETIYDQLNEQKGYLDKTEKQAQDVEEAMRTIEIILKRQSSNINKISDQIIEGQKEINSLNSDINLERAKFDQVLKELEGKYDKYYRISNSDFLEILFESENFSDNMNSLYFFETLISTDVNFLNDIRERNNRLMFKEKRLNNQLTVLKDKKQVIASLKEKILINKNKKEKLYSNLMAQKDEYIKKVHSLEQNSAEIEQLVQKLQQQSKNFKQLGTGDFISVYGYRMHPIFKVRSMHTGLDIAAPEGRPVFAVDDGIVMYSGKWGGYGKTVIIDHGGNRTTLYAHMSKYYVKRTLNVKKGQVIGLVGSTGWATGPHLHFEVRINGKVNNPINYLPKQ